MQFPMVYGVGGALAVVEDTGGGGTTFDLFQGFEGTGLPSDWEDLMNGSGYDTEDTNDIVSGSYSLRIHDNSTAQHATDYLRWAPTEMQGGVQIDSCEIYVNESGGSNGGGLAFLDGNGDDVCGWASSNPDWHLWTNNGWEDWTPGFESNGNWWRFKFVFDWAAGEFTVTGEQLSSGDQSSFTGTLRSTQGIEKLALRGFGTKGRGWDSSERHGSAYDDVRIVKS